MGGCTSEIINKTRSKDMEFSLGPMGRSSKGSDLMESSMGEGFSLRQVECREKDIGRMGRG